MRSALAVLLAGAWVCACAKAPDASTNPKASAETPPPATADASVDSGHPFGLPMPQQYPHFVWDAAASEGGARDGAASPLTR
jgi:hypothetical protein